MLTLCMDIIVAYIMPQKRRVLLDLHDCTVVPNTFNRQWNGRYRQLLTRCSPLMVPSYYTRHL